MAQAYADKRKMMFQQQLALEKEQLMQKEMDDIRAAEIELQKAQLNAQIRREQIEADLRKQDSKDAIQLQELELKAKADADKNYNELVKTVRESRNQNGDNNA